MKIFLVTMLFWTVGAHANDAEAGRLLACENLMAQKTLADTIADLARDYLDENVERTILIRTNSSPPIREFDRLVGHWRKRKIDVTAEIREFRKEGDITLIEFALNGRGREIAKALLEISNPATKLDFGQHPIHSLFVRPVQPLPELKREPPVGEELIEIAKRPIDRMDFAVRTADFFRFENIYFVGDLLVQSRKELSQRATPKVMKDIDLTLAEQGLRMGTVIPSWPFENLEIPKR